MAVQMGFVPWQVAIALGHAEPDLIRVLGPILEPTRAWRILCTPISATAAGSPPSSISS